MAERESMIYVRGSFSEAQGLCMCCTRVQFEEFDKITRVRLYDQLYQILDLLFEQQGVFRKSYDDKIDYQDLFFRCLERDVYANRVVIDKYNPYRLADQADKIFRVFENAPYNEVLDIIEYILRWISEKAKSGSKVFCDAMNAVFEKEYVGYRFVDRRIIPVTGKQEIESIEMACGKGFAGPRAHINKAVEFLADREHKDYKNCIKESISAVESICSIILEDDGATLGEAIKKLEKKGVHIHPALAQAVSKLYGYASAEGGIRHAEGMLESEVTFEEAQFMLVSCSAIVNYLTANYGKVG